MTGGRAPGRGPGGGGLLASAALIAAVTLVARAVGFGRWFVFSSQVSAQCVGQAYATANQVPNVLFEVAAGGALAGAVVPLLAGPLARGARAEVDQVASALLTWTLMVLVPLSLLLALAAGPVTDLLLGADPCPGQRSLAVRMLTAFAPQVPLYGLGLVLTGVLQAHRRFFWPALAPLLSSVVVIAAYRGFGATGGAFRDRPALLPAEAFTWLAWGTTAGVAVMTLPLLVPARRTGTRLRPVLRFPPGVARRAAALAGAGLAALLAQQVSVVAAVVLANRGGVTSTLTVYQYTQAVYVLPYAVLAVPLATSAFPRLAEQAATADGRFAATAAVTTRAVLAAACLGAAVVAATAPAVGAFFAHLDSGDVSRVPAALTASAPGLLGFALTAHVGRALYALEAGRVAAAATAAGWLVVAAASAVAVAVLPAADAAVALGVGTAVGMTAGGAALLAGLRRAAGPDALAGVARTGAVAAGAALAGALAGRAAAAPLLPPAAGAAQVVAAGVVAALLGAGCVAAGLAAADRDVLVRLRGAVR